MTDHIDIIFDQPPGPEGSRLIEVQDSTGRSIKIGEWVERPGGTWALRIKASEFANHVEGRKPLRDRVAEAMKQTGERVRREGPGNGRLK